MQKNKLLNVILLGFICHSSVQAMVVYDPTNWIQNAATAANTAQQLVTQSEQLKIALRDIQNYDGNIGQWANIQNLLQQLNNQVQQGEALSYSMRDLDAQFKRKYPGYVASQDYPKSYSVWSQTALDTLRGTLESSAMQANQFDNEQSRLNQLSNLSQSASGRMQAAQVGNMLATQQVSQMQQLRQLVIAQTNAQNAYASYEIQKDQHAEASSANWINAGDIHFPQYGLKK